MTEDKDRKRGLHRTQAPVDLFTLKPEPELVAEAPDAKRVPASKKATRAKARSTTAQAKDATQGKRVKTSVEFLPETLDLIEQMKSHYRREHRKHLPVWRILDEAIRDLATRRLK